MIKLLPLIKILTLILVVAFGGIAMGKYISTYNKPLTSEEASNQEVQKIQQEFEDADYVATPPTFGPIVQTTPLIVSYHGQDQASGNISQDQAQIIEERRPVILYDQDSYVLPLGGVVTAIKNTSDIEYTINITLPEQTNTEFLSNNVDVITKETVASKRIPLSALQEQSGLTYVWIVDQNNENQNTLEKLFINIGLSDEEYFEEDGEKIESYTLVVINPNDKIKADKEYKIFKTELAGPLHNPIRQAWMDYELNRLEQEQQAMLQIAEDCKNGKKALILDPGSTTTADGSAKLGGCGQSQTTDPMLQIFNSLTTTNNSGGCGQMSTAGCSN